MEKIPKKVDRLKIYKKRPSENVSDMETVQQKTITIVVELNLLCKGAIRESYSCC